LGTNTHSSDTYRPALFIWALATALAVFPLITLGGLVTSLRAGMVDPQSVRVPWYMFTLSWQDTAEAHGVGYLIEHGHRQLGWIVGLMTIALTLWVVLVSQRRWVKVLAVCALLGVSLQGVLGILRVELNRAGWGLELAMVHGITGQLVFTAVAMLPLVLSRSWISADPREAEGGQRFRKMCRLTLMLVLVQLVLGVCLRQLGSGSGYWLLIVHAVLALAILSHAVMLVVRTRRAGLRDLQVLGQPALWLLLLVVGQIILGTAGWWFGAGEGALDYRQVTVERAWLTTAHVGIGALVLVTITALTLRSYRHLCVNTAAAQPSLATASGVV
jgi:cytochrome c oxidase assembly protein subunit 15